MNNPDFDIEKFAVSTYYSSNPSYLYWQALSIPELESLNEAIYGKSKTPKLSENDEDMIENELSNNPDRN